MADYSRNLRKERDDGKSLDTAFIQVDDAGREGKKSDGKRGRGVAGKNPFVAAVARGDKGHPFTIRFSQVGPFFPLPR